VDIVLSTKNIKVRKGEVVRETPTTETTIPKRMYWHEKPKIRELMTRNHKHTHKLDLELKLRRRRKLKQSRREREPKNRPQHRKQ